MVRITRDDMLLGVAQVIAKRGTCSRLQVGAVFSKDGRIISTGYNGAPKGLPHCTHGAEPKLDVIGYTLGEQMNPEGNWASAPGKIMVRNPDDFKIQQYPEKGCEVAVHAEQNAIAFAARHGLALEGSDLYCTDAPCAACARSIINAGVKTVYYERPYRITTGVELLEAAGLEVIDMSQPGVVG